MKSLHVLVIFCLISVTALADIQTSNVYYTSGATVTNDVDLHNMDYTNCVDIYRNSISLSGAGENSSGSTDAKVSESASVTGSGVGPIGSNLDISAEKIQYAKGISAGLGLVEDSSKIGNVNEIKYSYLLSTGTEHANFFNKYASVDEKLISKENTYSAIFDATPTKLSLEGYGNRFSFEDKDSSLYYTLTVTQRDLWATTEAQLVATRINDVEVTPVIYAWNTSALSSGGDYATSHFDMAFIAGDRQVDAQITGRDSNGLVAYVPVDGTPWHVDPITDGSGSDDIQTIEDLITLIQQGVSNSGYMDWTLVPS